MDKQLKNKNFLFEIAHPKHFYQFKPVIEYFSKNNNIYIICRDKDVVLDLIKDSGLTYYIYGIHGKTIFAKIFFTPKILYDYIKVILKFKPDFVLSRSSPYASTLKNIFKFKSIIFPDSEVVPLINKYVAPNSDLIISPNNFSIDYGENHKRVSSFFETSYLNRTFTPDKNILDVLKVKENEVFFLLRFVSWQANHDFNNFGFSISEKIKLVNFLKKFGKVFVSSENNLPIELQQYRIKINPSKIHSLLYYTFLYIGDSQTMATEAALLGTPSLRYNSFVGKNDMSNFLSLEFKYHLMRNFSNFDGLYNYLHNINCFETLKDQWEKRKNEFFKNKMDINVETISIIEDHYKYLNLEL